MHTWSWNTWQGLPFLTCSLLQSWPHGFFTQQCWPRSPSELVVALLPMAEVYRAKQVHGNTIVSPSEIPAPTQGNGAALEEFHLPPADGLVTEQPQQAVWVCSADCTPVLVADVMTGRVAALHAGWRGVAAKIVPQAITRLQREGSQLSNLRVALGPAITGEVYQVSETVAAELGASVMLGLDDASVTVLEALQKLPESPLRADPEPGCVRIDIRRVIALQLEQLGLGLEQMAIAPHCTYRQPEHFFSYRRDGQKKVQWSGIVSIQLGYR